MQLVHAGFTYREIGKKMGGISASTVSTHLRHVCLRLGESSNRPGIVAARFWERALAEEAEGEAQAPLPLGD